MLKTGSLKFLNSATQGLVSYLALCSPHTSVNCKMRRHFAGGKGKKEGAVKQKTGDKPLDLFMSVN